MHNKKNWKKNLENFRTIFFMVGLALSLMAATEIIQWTTEYRVPEPKEPIEESTFAIPNLPPITFPEKPEIPEPKKEPEPEPIKLDADKFKKVDNDFKEPTRPTLNLGDLNDTMATEFMGLPEVPEPVTVYVVENMARPKDCEALQGKKEQMDCFSNFVKFYLADEVNFPRSNAFFATTETVYVQFVIDEFGMVKNVEAIRGENPDFREEAVRAISELPELVPAKQMGRPVPVKVVVPVRFRLD